MLGDADLIALFFARDEAAIEETQNKYGSFCRGLARSLLADREDAEECVNEALLALWNSIPPNRPDYFRAYLGRIIRNGALSIYRKANARKRSAAMTVALTELEECIPSGEDVEDRVEKKELTKAIDDWLSTLRERDRMLFVRRYWYGDPVQALADRMGMTPNNASQKLFTLRKQLKTCLERKGIRV